MRRITNLWPNVITFDNLYLAYSNARKGKQQHSVASFSLSLEQELLGILRALVNKT